MTNFIKTTTTAKVDMGAILDYISEGLHRLVTKGSDVSFLVSHYIPDEPDLNIRARYLTNLYVLVEVKLKKLGTIYTSQPIYVCSDRHGVHNQNGLQKDVEQALQKAITELTSNSRNDLLKSLNDGAEFFKSFRK